MKDFLEIVADDLLQRMGNDLSHTIVVFPNKRASLFFNEYLTPNNGKPIWAPRYLSIGELFSSLSDKQIIDPIEAVCRLYNHYVKYVESPKPTLDFFYGWGERLLADFDDIDKNLVDTKKLFREISEYTDLEQYDFLDENQIKQLKRFAADFSQEKLNGIRANFNKLWKIAYQVYNDFNQDLSNDNLAYEGHLFREIAQKMQEKDFHADFKADKIAFVGFNVIDKCEQSLFKYLQNEDKALFYWDYDISYAKKDGSMHTDAGRFMQENLISFPNALENEEIFNNFMSDRQLKTMQFASAPTNTAQAQSIKDWLNAPKNFDPQKANRTAVVVCDENLLQGVIHSLPSRVKEVNITKGFPLGQTPAFTCVLNGMEILEKEGQTDSLVIIETLQNRVKGEASQMDENSLNDQWLHALYTEAYFQSYTTLTRFQRLIETKLLNVRTSTLFSLIKQAMRSISIPFHGEPAEGLQIMGVLETRCLDFDNLVMLSVNEGVLPRKAGEASFIPFLLRKQYGMTTPERQNSVFAYYFYRLLQRAKNVRLVYNNSTEGSNRGEMSRFMKALLIDSASNMNISKVNLTSIPKPLDFSHGTEIGYQKSNSKQTNFEISPSALKNFIKCELQYYYKYILKLKTPQKQDSIINANDFGTVFHDAAEHLYTQVLDGNNRTITPATIERFLQKGGAAELEKITEKSFQDNHIESSPITHIAVKNYLVKLLNYEAGKDNYAPFTSIKEVEAENESSIILKVPYKNGFADVKLYGYIDRKDNATLSDNKQYIRIIDYKTGKKKEDNKLKMDDFFAGGKKFPENPLQAFIYSLMWTQRTSLPVVPMLYYLPSMSGKSFSPYITVDNTPIMDFATIADDFKQRLIEKLAELIDPNHEFKATEVTDHCKYCDFKEICGR